MQWQDIADDIFLVRPWFFPILGALFLIPLLRAVTAPIQYGGCIFMRINRIFGKWEHLVMLPRDFIAAPYLSAFALWQIIRAIWLYEWERGVLALIATGLVGLCFLQRSFRKKAHLKLLDFARENPAMHPQEFFDHMLCSSGAVRHKLPNEPFRKVDHTDLDFLAEGKKTWLPWLSFFCGTWSTVWVAKLIALSSKKLAGNILKEIASALALVWAARVSQLINAHVTVEGREFLNSDAGLDIFLFTHASFLDFALAGIALAARPQDTSSPAPSRCLPTFLVAKDHFRDNPIYYRILGIGRCAELLGMIFVDRKNTSGSERARMVAQKASELLADGGADLAIYPQGTRSAPCINPREDRIDSAYYTVGTRDRIKGDGLHLKKGAAHIAVNTALTLAAKDIKQNVRIVPVAIMGTGIACPKGSIKIRPNTQICLRIEKPIVIFPEQAFEISKNVPEFVENLHAKIDLALKTAAHVHAVLERRFFEDIRSMLDPLQIEEISLAIKPWRKDDFLVHAILDAIYSCPKKKWRAFIGELSHLLLNFAPRSELLAFKSKIADAIPL